MARQLLLGWEITPMSDDSGRQLALLGGDVDISTAPGDATWLQTVRGEPGFCASAAPYQGVEWFQFDVTKKPFDDVRVRKAVAYAISRDAHISH